MAFLLYSSLLALSQYTFHHIYSIQWRVQGGLRVLEHPPDIYVALSLTGLTECAMPDIWPARLCIDILANNSIVLTFTWLYS